MAKSKFKIKVKNSNGTVSVRGDVTAKNQEEADAIADKLSKNTGFTHFAEFVETLEEDKVEEEVEAEVESEEEAEVEEEESEEEDEVEEEDTKVSTDMLADDAVAHIENTPLEDLEGFVTDDEDRVTIQRALNKKIDEEG